MSLSQLIAARKKDIGGLFVGRILPYAKRRMVGPFIFMDEMGPAELGPGQRLDVRPHPHIHLATVTYLFEGTIMHRDSLGNALPIEPGAINWMVAGTGIVHSERSPAVDTAQQVRLHGIQTWVALPTGQEEIAPSFTHYPASSLPRWQQGELEISLLMGAALGQRSPVAILSPTLYLALQSQGAAQLELPLEVQEIGVYLVKGGLKCQGQELKPGELAVFDGLELLQLELGPETQVMVLGGDPVGERHVWWNFVSSRPEAIAQAKSDWQALRFARVPGDEQEFIPLPDDWQGV